MNLIERPDLSDVLAVMNLGLDPDQIDSRDEWDGNPGRMQNFILGMKKKRMNRVYMVGAIDVQKDPPSRGRFVTSTSTALLTYNPDSLYKMYEVHLDNDSLLEVPLCEIDRISVSSQPRNADWQGHRIRFLREMAGMHSEIRLPKGSETYMVQAHR